ncbi:ABC transporter permease [Frankia sp. CNm7]|uniref:FtsX-like permease family protein n=1 Tax=Frankia nepalensis TaxID=1836974 RepID=UPI0019332EE0|nr:FtsX family ABC transporter permease [Frankia nepalensis]MBL7523445.1 ABC transporter permease [Frankia nepalensis]
MIRIVWHTVRARKGSLVGTFVALALGVALLAAMALTLVSSVGGGEGRPTWYGDADVVVAGGGTVSVTTGSGDDRETASLRTAGTRGLPGGLPERLAGLDAALVVDFAAYAVSPGAPGATAHPWSAAALHPYEWVAGGPPRDPADVVLTAPTDHRPGTEVTVVSGRGVERFVVSGVLRTDAPAALYITDAVARDLADGRVAAVALTLPGAGPSAEPSVGPDAEPGAGAARSVASLAGAARAAVGDAALEDGSVQVLTGNDRRRAEPDPDAERRTEAVALLAATTGLAGFVSIFVVSGTFAYAVTARRREFGLLRAAGATPRQVFRIVLGEALLVGVLASLAGGALGAAIAPDFAARLARTGFVPSDFTARFVFWPVAAAFGTGLGVALLGAWVAARRAGRVRPVEALREAAVDRRPMTTARAVAGLVALGCCVPLVAVLMANPSADAVALIMITALFLIVACAMFAPLVVPPLVSLLCAPLSGSSGAVGLLAGHGARAAVLRTAATAAPILVTVGIAGSTLTGLGTLQAATQNAARERITAEALAVPVTGRGLPDAAVAARRAVGGVSAAVPVTESRVYVRDGDEPEGWTGRYASGADLTTVLDVPLVAGSLADLAGTDTVAVPAGRWELGETAELWLGDSTPARLRVVAVLGRQLDLAETVLLPWRLRAGHAVPVADVVYLRLAPGASLEQVRAAAAAQAATVADTGSYLSAAGEQEARVGRQASVAMLGLSLVYTGIAIANTLVMATRDRAREFATLRLAGATRRQVLAVVGVEAVLVTCVGVLLAVAVTAVTALGARHGLADVAPSVPLAVPWAPLAAIVLACLVTAVLASVLPAALLLRRRPAELAGVRE